MPTTVTVPVGDAPLFVPVTVPEYVTALPTTEGFGELASDTVAAMAGAAVTT